MKISNLPLRFWEEIFAPPEETKPQRKILERLHDFLEEQPPACAACVWEIRKAVDDGRVRWLRTKTGKLTCIF